MAMAGSRWAISTGDDVSEAALADTPVPDAGAAAAADGAREPEGAVVA
jgi:hypothetical protein